MKRDDLNYNDYIACKWLHSALGRDMDKLFLIISVATGQRMVRESNLLIASIENILEFDLCKIDFHTTSNMQCQNQMQKTLKHSILYFRHSIVIPVLLISTLIFLHTYCIRLSFSFQSISFLWYNIVRKISFQICFSMFYSLTYLGIVSKMDCMFMYRANVTQRSKIVHVKQEQYFESVSSVSCFIGFIVP